MSESDVPSGTPARIETPTPGDPRIGRLSLNQRTIERWSLREAIDGCLEHGIPAIGPWREQVAEVGTEIAARWLKESGLRVSSLCRGGFFTGPERVPAHEENLRALEEAAALGAQTLVLVPGGLPPGDRDLDAARARAGEAVAALVERATAVGVTLGIEPMHPIFAADRGVVSTLAQALEIAADHPPAAVGVVVDAYHLWWEPGIHSTVRSAGERIVSYQVSDWIMPLRTDALLSRGMMGDGHIDYASLTAAVTETGYGGDVEVEIFNADLWAADPRASLRTMIRRYSELVAPHLAPGKIEGERR